MRANERASGPVLFLNRLAHRGAVIVIGVGLGRESENLLGLQQPEPGIRHLTEVEARARV